MFLSFVVPLDGMNLCGAKRVHRYALPMWNLLVSFHPPSRNITNQALQWIFGALKQKKNNFQGNQPYV